MHENDARGNKDTVPEIYSAICISIKRNIDVNTVITELNEAGIEKVHVRKPKHETNTIIALAVIYYKRFWELDHALTEMFGLVDNSLFQLKEIAKKYSGKVYIDIAFCQHGTYPALLFYGANMEKIRYLEADISIDPYSM